MLTEAEALDRILAGIPTPQSELVPLPEAAGRWLTEDVRAGIALPGFDHAAMDGYALHADDCGKAGIALTVCGEQPAGRDLGLHVRPGVVVRIFTGAPLPGATGAVIMQEDVARTGASITVLEAARPGEWIRRAGSDVCAVQLIAARGDRLSPALLGAMAGQGMVSATAGRLPRVAIICTGGELISPGLPLPHHGCLYNSNGPMLASMMNGCAMALPPDTVVDELASLTYLLQTRLMECDAVITVGGASVGEHDLVRPALEAAGMPLEFWRVNVKPGKPFLFSSCGGKVVFGLPGNPVSAFVTAWLFVLPALRRMAGAADAAPVRISATAGAALVNKGDRPHYMRGQWKAGVFAPLGMQESHALTGLSRANALALVPAAGTIGMGEAVELLPL